MCSGANFIFFVVGVAAVAYLRRVGGVPCGFARLE